MIKLNLSLYVSCNIHLTVFLNCLKDLKLSNDLIILLRLSVNSNIFIISKHLKKNGYSKQKNIRFLVGEHSVWKNKDKYILLGENTFNKFGENAGWQQQGVWISDLELDFSNEALPGHLPSSTILRDALRKGELFSRMNNCPPNI